MPLYELILISRVGSAKGSANLLKQLSYKILEEGGVVRKAHILGDRVMTKQLRGVDQKKHLVGRYMQLLYDVHPNVNQILQRVAKESFEVIKVKNFAVKDFFNDAQMFKQTKEFQSQVYHVEDEEFRQKLQEIQQKQKQLDQKSNSD